MSYLSKSWHVPGYTGHIPSQKGEVGKTFGTISCEVVSSESVPRSKVPRAQPHLSASAGAVALSPAVDAERQKRDVMRDHERRREGSQLRQDMVPGYTGHVPRARDYTGASYSKVNTRGIVEHEIEQRYKEEKLLHTVSSMQQRELERALRHSSVAPRSHTFNPDFYDQRREPAFTPRVKYSQTVGVMPGASIFVPERQATDVGKSYARATKESAMSLRGKQVRHNALAVRPSEFVSPVKASNDLHLSMTHNVKALGETAPTNKPVFEKKHKSQFVF